MRVSSINYVYKCAQAQIKANNIEPCFGNYLNINQEFTDLVNDFTDKRDAGNWLERQPFEKNEIKFSVFEGPFAHTHALKAEYPNGKNAVICSYYSAREGDVTRFVQYNRFNYDDPKINYYLCNMKINPELMVESGYYGHPVVTYDENTIKKAETQIATFLKDLLQAYGQ